MGRDAVAFRRSEHDARSPRRQPPKGAQQVTDCMQPRNPKSRPTRTDVAMRDFVWLSQIMYDSGRKPRLARDLTQCTAAALGVRSAQGRRAGASGRAVQQICAEVRSPSDGPRRRDEERKAVEQHQDHGYAYDGRKLPRMSDRRPSGPLFAAEGDDRLGTGSEVIQPRPPS